MNLKEKTKWKKQKLFYQTSFLLLVTLIYFSVTITVITNFSVSDTPQTCNKFFLLRQVQINLTEKKFVPRVTTKQSFRNFLKYQKQLTNERR